MHAFGAVFAEVAVDPDLGTVRVRRAVGAYGAGRIVNPRLARSQCIGGMVGGIGMALMEQHRARSARRPPGQRITWRTTSCRSISTSARSRRMFVDEDDPHVNPLGVKGLGEIALVGVAPAIANAVFHATGQPRARPADPHREPALTAFADAAGLATSACRSRVACAHAGIACHQRILRMRR